MILIKDTDGILEPQVCTNTPLVQGSKQEFDSVGLVPIITDKEPK